MALPFRQLSLGDAEDHVSVRPTTCVGSAHVQTTNKSASAGVGSRLLVLLQEEIQRRRARAAKYGTEDTLAAYQPVVDPEDAARRKKRAERFGVDYQPEDAAGLMDVGALLLLTKHACSTAPPPIAAVAPSPSLLVPLLHMLRGLLLPPLRRRELPRIRGHARRWVVRFAVGLGRAVLAVVNSPRWSVKLIATVLSAFGKLR